MLKIYRNEGEIISKEGDELASIIDVEEWTGMTGKIINGIFEVCEGIYHWVDLTFLDPYEFCGYTSIKMK